MYTREHEYNKLTQMDVIQRLKQISNSVARSEISHEDAAKCLESIFADSSEHSLRWKIFSDKRITGTARAKLGKAHCRRLKRIAETIDPGYFNDVDWGEI